MNPREGIRGITQDIKGRAARAVINHLSPTPEYKPGNIWERFPELKEIPLDKFPKHIFIIPDGNRRFANEQGQESFSGHKAGLKKMLEILNTLQELPVETITMWGFSDHNWSRPEKEKEALMNLFGTAITDHVSIFNENNVKFVHLGRKDRIPRELAEKLNEAEETTKENTGKTVCVAIDFGGEDHEERVVKKSVIDAVRLSRENPELTPEKIADSFNQKKIKTFYDGEGNIPPADMIIRTSEKRTSDPGFIEGAQTELFFIEDKYFPELEDKDIVDAILYFASRERRLGK